MQIDRTLPPGQIIKIFGVWQKFRSRNLGANSMSIILSPSASHFMENIIASHWKHHFISFHWEHHLISFHWEHYLILSHWERHLIPWRTSSHPMENVTSSHHRIPFYRAHLIPSSATIAVDDRCSRWLLQWMTVAVDDLCSGWLLHRRSRWPPQ